jgi:hypothetical protein
MISLVFTDDADHYSARIITTMANTRINLLTATIKDLQESLEKGEVTSVQLVTDYLVSCCNCSDIQGRS